ncbi:MAG: 2-oxoglutarate dehydrogenase E1 component [Gammaproteobacteria bacterium]|nr:2-oxoglutarate dehydrogenase E1 component [Gammaproteobacteria bacterium]MCY4218438.1 2-oxoglutarate dehydrogenase E1 component [Gammaproteobacteria bacterium]
MKQNDNGNLSDLGFLSGGNMHYLESLYSETMKTGGAVSSDTTVEQWRTVFESLPVIVPREINLEGSKTWLETAEHKQERVARLIMTYRMQGHLRADIDPIGIMPRGEATELDLSEFDLNENDLDSEFDIGGMRPGGRMALRDILSFLQKVYCGSIGYEINHINSREKRLWLCRKVESKFPEDFCTVDERLKTLERLVAAEGLEKYLHTKYVGQKRFSLEGGDSLIPMIADLVQQFGAKGVNEVVIGMAHRGRLNVLVNILGKSPKELFSEFEGRYDFEIDNTSTGDVKYHQGFSSDIKTPAGNVHVALSFNPSHLEIINPVVQGSVRARQERRQDTDRSKVVPILVHGDASFAGQGVVMETLNMAQTRGYSTGGTIHIIVNNQIGFTTNTLDARSTLYCTEVAKLVQAPIFHVNGDDPDAVMYATRLAMEYRMNFKKDVVLDLVCYRRHGHNEADEPSITQPVMYSIIRKHQTPREIYAKTLIDDGLTTEKDVQVMLKAYRDRLDKGKVVAGQIIDPNKALVTINWEPYLGGEWREDVNTQVATKRLGELAEILSRSPNDFTVHPKVQSILEDRIAMAQGDKPMDWGCAEMLAYASLLDQGYLVRLSGQDTGRGTFSHRHATLHDQKIPRTHIPMQYNIVDNPSNFLVINSLLSEEAVLGFEYGYATTEPNALVIWEGQFGDFVNGAQVVIDQFISSGQPKWGRICGLVMFLPHGMEGQGPEHSSARLERFLQLCANNNIQVCNPTTPCQIFHLLRRQMLRNFRRPMIVMTPKSLLRHKLSVSTTNDLAKGSFQPVIGEIDDIDSSNVQRVVLCSGKVYYDILEQRRLKKINDIAVLRLEQLYPFPDRELVQNMQQFKQAVEIVWCQEEPKNQGSWYQIYYPLSRLLKQKQRLKYIGREESASPAVGYYQLHIQQQQHIVNAALSLEEL